MLYRLRTPNNLPQDTPDFTHGYLTNAPYLLNTVTGPANTVNRTHEPARDVLKKIESRRLDNTLVSAYDYTVNGIGQRKQVLTTGTAFNGVPGDWDWDYDSMGQLTTAEASTPANSRAYQYDAIDNRLFSEVSNHEISDPPAPGTTAYTANSLNQYESITGGGFQPSGPTHDLDGNETSGPVPGAAGNTPGAQPPAHATDLQWDAENRLVSATIGTDTITYRYDHLSRLVVRKLNNAITHRYFYDGWNRIAEYIGSGALQDTFTWGLDLSGALQGAGGVGGLLATRWVSATNSPDYYPTYDGNGNITEYLTPTGAVAAHYEYDPFGNLTRQTESSDIRFQYRFSTKPRDSDTGLYHYGHRLYTPLTGSWLSPDPIGERGGLNMYGFVAIDGVNLLDFLGLGITHLDKKQVSNSDWEDAEPLPSWKGESCRKISIRANAGGEGETFMSYPQNRDEESERIFVMGVNGPRDFLDQVRQLLDKQKEDCPCVCIKSLTFHLHGANDAAGRYAILFGKEWLVHGPGDWQDSPFLKLGDKIAPSLCKDAGIRFPSCGVGSDLSKKALEALAFAAGAPVIAPRGKGGIIVQQESVYNEESRKWIPLPPYVWRIISEGGNFIKITPDGTHIDQSSKEHIIRK